MLHNRTITLIVSGGIAAYKALELVRLLKKDGARVIPILTKGGAQFVTPLSLAALTEEKVYDDLFSLTQESEMGHITLSRGSDLIVVAPASADIMAKMAHGLADDLAATVLLAANKPVLLAPAMNPQMWAALATRTNVSLLKSRGVIMIGPVAGDTACGEEGTGRMAEPADILTAIRSHFTYSGPLSGKKAIVTAGPTHEPLDPVRYIANRSSGKQGFAIAEALARLGAEVHLVSGPVELDLLKGIATTNVNTAAEMLATVKAKLPADIVVCAAAVADWRVKKASEQKIKKDDKNKNPVMELEENPDILAFVAKSASPRPAFVVGFAAETQDLKKTAEAKLEAKGCDAILANNVSEGVFGTDDNRVIYLSKSPSGVQEEFWPLTDKKNIARLLADRIVNHFLGKNK